MFILIMANYPKNRLRFNCIVIVVVIVCSISVVAKPKYITYRIPEVAIDSTMSKVLLQEVIPALDSNAYKPFSWMMFSPRSIYAGDTTANLVGAVWAIENQRVNNPNLFITPKGFCKLGTKIIFFRETDVPYIKKKKNGKFITIKYLNAKIVHSVEFDPAEIKIIRLKDGYKVIYPKTWVK